MHVQALDVFVFSVFKQHHADVAEEFIEKNGLRGSLKLTASQSLTLCIRLNCSAWLREGLQNADPVEFRILSYYESQWHL